MNRLRAGRISSTPSTDSGSKQEAGVALIMVIIALLLITAVAAAMVILSNSEVNIDSNYRDAQVALYSAKAGLQEARDRMLTLNASPITLPSVLPGASGGSYATYIIAPGVSPRTSTNTMTTMAGTQSLFDSEFMCEMTPSTCVTATTFPNAASCCTTFATSSTYSGSASNPLAYQWVRINLKLDQSAYGTGNTYYVDGNSANATKQVMYDTTSGHECVAGGGACVAAGANTFPVYEITSLAVTKTGTRRMLQDEVAAVQFNLNLDGALTIPGTVGSFNGGNSNNYAVNGNDGSGNAPAVAGCTPNQPAVAAIDVTNANSSSTVDSGIPGNRTGHYTGSACNGGYGSTPCIGMNPIPSSMSSPANLIALLQQIKQQANVVLQPNPLPPNGVSTTQYSFANVQSAPGSLWSNLSGSQTTANTPQITYVDGDFSLGPNTGSGLLVVTGNFSYAGNSGWNGVILVVGDGTTTFDGSGGGNGQFDGAFLVATTRDANGNVLANFGTADFNINGGGGNGIFYNSCWVKNSEPVITYQLLSSKEIAH